MAPSSTASRLVSLLALAGLIAGCGRPPDRNPPPPEPALRNAADSLAARIADAGGGTAALDALPALRWDFVVVRDSVETSRSHHLWDREGGYHRLEWRVGDSLLVALFSTERAVDGMPVDGDVYLEGMRVDTTATPALLEQAYSRFINDMYWLLAPMKVFDPGVHRAVAVDSADNATEVLALSFEGVGLTPGDRYWLRADRSTGRVTSWSYQLESGRRRSYAWNNERTVETPAGPLTLPTRKSPMGGGTVILTPFEAGVVDSTFADPRPRLEPLR